MNEVKTITLPGLIDPHVHLRDPGQTHKEDFYTGTSAALAGGYVAVLDMPNNPEPITSLARLEAKIANAAAKTVCDIGFNFGTLGDNLAEFPKVIDKVAALKIYLNRTTGGFIIDSQKLLDIYKAWPSDKPIMLHAEADVLPDVIKAIRATRKTSYVCHVSSQEELEFVLRAKDEGLPVHCGVTPHHLFLSLADETRLDAFGLMKPSLKPRSDQDFLWQHMDGIDVIESDHAPHTRAEKQAANPPFGVPGLETTLPLVLSAEQAGKLSRQQLIDRLHANPARLFTIPVDPTTSVTVNMQPHIINEKDLHTKCQWSPFAGQQVAGFVQEVKLHGKTVYEHGKLLTPAGSGRVINWL